MKLFIWNNLSYITFSFHNNGGVAVVADTLDAAKDAIPFCPDDLGLKTSVVNRSQRDVGEPDACFEVGDVPATVFVFPNAGCC